MPERRRYAIVVAGSRSAMFVQAITTEHARLAELVAFADVNQVRMDVHNGWLTAAGHDPVPTYRAGDLAAMPARERVDELIVTSVDSTHAGHIVTALQAGCDVITEKPMTVDGSGARQILAAVERTGRRVSVSFNYRFNPVHELVRTLLAGGDIGEIGSVHFEWLLDVRHSVRHRWRCSRPAGSSSTARTGAGMATGGTTYGRTGTAKRRVTRSPWISPVVRSCARPQRVRPRDQH